MIKAGVATGNEVQEIFEHAKKNKYALPAINVVNTSSVNAVLESARDNNSPAMIQFSAGGCQFFAGKGLSNDIYQSSISGGISGAIDTHTLAELYGATIILHTDHCAKKLLPWIDGLLNASEDFFKVHGKSLYSSHMIDLSEEPLEENLDICKRYLERMSKMDMTLEIELGITGGEEDGVDNSDVESSKLYTQPEEVKYAFDQLSEVSDQFTVAAAFGNVHGVYKPGNVELRPVILDNCQKHISEQNGLGDKPVDFVFHGGSGSSLEEIRENDHNLNIRRYADTSPPPENFDVKGILNGGIPIKEIQDDYIQEILDGFDVSSVLVSKDDEYMMFKEEIKDKLQIRQLLADVSDLIIEQF